jgi:hypothetical protein
MSMGSRPSIGTRMRNLISSIRGTNRIGHKTQGKANTASSRKGRIRNNSARWGSQARTMPKYRAYKRQRRAGNNG